MPYNEEKPEKAVKYELLDIVRFDHEGESGVGVIESIDENEYTVRVYATTESGEMESTDTVHTLPLEAISDFFEKIDEDLEELKKEFEEEEEIKADVGEFVQWESGRGVAQGRIEELVTDRVLEVPDTDFSIEGTEEDPAALIEVYERVEGGWKPSGIMVGHLVSTLERTDPLDVVEESSDTPDKPKIMAKMRSVKMEVQKDEEGNDIGILETKLSAFGKVDLGGDTVDKNAYNQTVKQKGQIRMQLDHKYDTPNYVGTLYLKIEDDGLYARAEMPLDAPSVKEAYIKAKFSIKCGDPLGMSIGYDPIKSEPGPNGTRILKEIALHEASITPFPMDLEAKILEAKSKKMTILKKQQDYQRIVKKSAPTTSPSEAEIFSLLNEINSIVTSFRGIYG